MLKLIAQNKYKLMVFIIGLYLLVDVLQHKGQTRVLFPKSFMHYKTDTSMPKSKATLVNHNKEWEKGVNTKALMNEADVGVAGLEFDVYFDKAKHIFDVHHDADKSIGQDLNGLLEIYQQKKLTASIWLDFKNLDDANAASALGALIQLRNTYNLQNKLLIESGRADLLSAFSDGGFYTSYYTPMFNPYQLSNEEIKYWVDSISTVIKNASVNALSGYYFQYAFLQNYFPNYPVLIWAEKARFSLVNQLFRKKIAADKSIFIVLYP